MIRRQMPAAVIECGQHQGRGCDIDRCAVGGADPFEILGRVQFGHDHRSKFAPASIGSPSVPQMLGPVPRRDQNDVETDATSSKARVSTEKLHCRACDARLLAGAQRFRSIGICPAGLNLHKAQNARGRPCNEVDFAQRRTEPACKNAIAFEHQRERGPIFAPAAAPLGIAPVAHVSAISRHRERHAPFRATPARGA